MDLRSLLPASCFLLALGAAPPSRAQPPAPAPVPVPTQQAAPAPGDSAAEAQAKAPESWSPALSQALETQPDALGRACDPQAIVVQQDLRYLACGQAGVWVVRVLDGATLAVLARHDLNGFVRGFFERDAGLWAEVTMVQAFRVAQLGQGELATVAPPAPPRPSQPAQAAPATSSAPTSASASTPPAQSLSDRDGEVVQTGPGYVVVDLGSARGIDEGQRIAFHARETQQIGEDLTTTRMRLLAVGEVESVSETRARVRLGTGERVPVGSRARRSVQPLTASSIAPPRAGGVWEAGFMARPFLVLDELGGGVVTDAWLGRRFEAPFHLEARVAPLAIGSADRGTTVPFAAFVTASYDAKLFEVGLGIGGETVNSPAFDLPVGSGLSVVQRVRLGAIDGLNLTAFTHVVLFHSEFEFSTLRMQAQIPFNGTTWLIAGGGGGTVGVGYGEIGLRTLLAGNGDRDSFFLTALVGGVTVFEEESCFDFAECVGTNIDYAGPMVGIGGEWRY